MNKPAAARAPTPTLPRMRGREGPAPLAWEGGGNAATAEGSNPTPAAALTVARRIVLKIGSALLVAEDGEIGRAHV